MNILIVDDERDQVESLARGLRKQKLSVLEAHGGQEALDHLEKSENGVDMVIADYAMPNMDGIELLKEIRSRYDYIPVIIMTAYGNKDLIIEAIRNSCDSFIEKPFTLEGLLAEIDRVRQTLGQQTGAHPLFKLLPRVIHQLNRPLMIIKGNAELSLLHLDNPDVLRRYISRIMGAVERIDAINRQLLTLSIQDDRRSSDAPEEL
jgi:DNA-binding response OmpR family regulator